MTLKRLIEIVLIVTLIVIAGACRVKNEETTTDDQTTEIVPIVEETHEKVEPVEIEIEIVPDVSPVIEPEIEEPTYTDEELEILAIIIYQEAGGDACSDETRLMVGNVFLNRVASDRYPDTFLEVATQKQQYGRLYWTGLKWPDRAVNAGEVHAVARAYDIAKRLLDGERVLPEDVIYQAEFPQGHEIVAEQNGLYFCR